MSYTKLNMPPHINHVKIKGASISRTFRHAMFNGMAWTAISNAIISEHWTGGLCCSIMGS